VTWLLIIIAFSVAGGPDQPIDPPAHADTASSLADCHRKARNIASMLSRSTDGGHVSLIYECRPEQGPTT
jgi:hypothetical protein